MNDSIPIRRYRLGDRPSVKCMKKDDGWEKWVWPVHLDSFTKEQKGDAFVTISKMETFIEAFYELVSKSKMSGLDIYDIDEVENRSMGNVSEIEGDIYLAKTRV